MGQKIFKTLDEQVTILRSKGLIINDESRVKEILLRENYFFISGYRHIFLDNNSKRYITGTTFEELYSMFLFDRKIRNIMFKNILVIENNIKSIVSYQLSKKYGYKEKQYLDPKNYNQDPMAVRQVNDVLSKMKRQIRVNGKQHTATTHYINNYGYIPMWILVKVLSFGIIGELYAILQKEDQIKIAQIYGIDIETLKIYLSLLSNFRNLCAHEDILYNHRTQRVIPNNKYHEKLNIEMINDEYIYGKNDLFALIIMMKKMLSSREFTDLVNEISYEIDVLCGKISNVDVNGIINKIGFPNNWRDIAKID